MAIRCFDLFLFISFDFALSRAKD